MRKNLSKKLISAVICGTMVLGTAISASADPTPISTSKDLNVKFTLPDTIEFVIDVPDPSKPDDPNATIGMTGNDIDFGTVTGLTSTKTSTPDFIYAGIKSSLPYDVTIQGLDDFKAPDVTTVIPIEKLGFSLVEAETEGSSFTPVTKSVQAIVSNAPATEGEKVSHKIDFELQPTIGYTAGTYTAPIKLVATQK